MGKESAAFLQKRWDAPRGKQKTFDLGDTGAGADTASTTRFRLVA